MVGIYKITSPSNRIYIGQSCNIEKRFNQYKNLFECRKQTKLYNSFNKYGYKNHIFEIVILCYEEQLNEFERDFQDAYDVIGPNGLNCKLTKVGDKSGKLSQETKDKIGNANRGRIFNEEVLNKIKKFRSNFKFSEETKQKMSESAKNRYVSPERLIGMKNIMKLNFSKKVINIETNEIYNSCTEAALLNNMNNKTLSKKLSGLRNNNTNLRYLDIWTQE